MTSSPPPSYYSQCPVPLDVEAFNRSSRQLGLLLANPPDAAGRDAPPPSYSSITNREQPTGPTNYPGNGRLLLIINWYLVLQFFAKFGIFLIWVFQNEKKGSIMAALGCLYFFSIFNVWLFCMVYAYKDYMTLARFKLHHFLRTPWPYFLLLDNIILIELPIIGLKFHLNVNTAFNAGIILSFLNVLAYYLVSHFEITDYAPLREDDKYILVLESTETKPESPFQVLESSSFKIRLKVVSPVKNQSFKLERKTSKLVNTNRGPKKSQFKCTFHFGVDAEIPVGTTAMMIPETHELPGALKVKDYRSFGFNKINEVDTRIYGVDEYGRETLYARFKQTYRLRS